MNIPTQVLVVDDTAVLLVECENDQEVEAVIAAADAFAAFVVPQRAVACTEDLVARIGRDALSDIHETVEYLPGTVGPRI